MITKQAISLTRGLSGPTKGIWRGLRWATPRAGEAAGRFTKGVGRGIIGLGRLANKHPVAASLIGVPALIAGQQVTSNVKKNYLHTDPQLDIFETTPLGLKYKNEDLKNFYKNLNIIR